MTGKDFLDAISACPLIIAILNDETFNLALASDHEIVFILDANICNLKDRIRLLLEKNKKVFVHIDMVQGLSSNSAVVDYIADSYKGEVGIITTKHNLIRRANQRNIRSIYRGFIVDSKSKNIFLSNLKEGIHPDAVEVLPAFVTGVIKEIKELYPSLIVIAGGLVTQKKEAYEILNSGASAISSSSLNLLGD